MKYTRWAVLGALAVVLALGAAWVGFQGMNSKPVTTENATPTAPELTPPDTSQPVSESQNTDQAPSQTDASPEGPTQAPPAQGNADTSQAPTTSAQDGVEVLYGELVSEINAVEFQLYCVKDKGCQVPQSFVLLGLSPTDLALSNEGQRLDYWLLNHFPEASVSIVETWFKENRIAVNDQLVGQTYKLKPDDLIALQITEFSALKVALADYLKQPDRVEYDLFEISMAPTAKLKQSGIMPKRYLAVGKLFNRDIRNVNLDTLGNLKDNLAPWDKWEFVGTFGPYRLYELS